jgi:hypothetical protein
MDQVIETTAATDLIISLPAVPNVKTFTDEAEFNKLYDAILQKVNEHKHDVSTKKGRDEIKSLAHKIAKTKAALDRQGFALTEEWRLNKKKVDATRNKIDERLVALQTKFRKPLTDWENAEEARVKKHQAALDALLGMISTPSGHTSAELREAALTVELTIVDASWEEFEDRAALAKEDASAALARLIVAAEKSEADARELEELRAAKAKLEQEKAELAAAEEAKRIEAQRVENERIAEEKRQADIAQAAKDAAGKATRDAAQAVADAERRAEEAKAQAERDIADAKAETERQAAAEKKRIADEQEAEAAAQRRRDANKEHKKAINNSIVAELVKCSKITEEQAQAIVIHLVCGLVPNVTLQY